MFYYTLFNFFLVFNMDLSYERFKYTLLCIYIRYIQKPLFNPATLEDKNPRGCGFILIKK